MPNIPAFKPLTNRSTEQGKPRFALPEDGMVQLVPKGAAPNTRADGTRIIQLVDDAALQAMLNRAVTTGGEVLMDFEHNSRSDDKPTDAAAWLPQLKESLQIREDGLYGSPRWSVEGEAAVTGGKLRFISPEFPDDDSLLQHVSGNTYRPLAVVGFGLTNRPGFKRHAKPLTNSSRHDPAEPTETPMHKAFLAQALSLTESELDKLDENTLRNRVQGLKDKAAKADQAEADLAVIKNKEADDFITKHEKVLKNEAVKKHVRDQFLTNRQLAEALVQGMHDDDDSMTEAERQRAERQPLHNRSKAEAPKPDAAETRKQQVLANRRSNRATAMLKNKEYPTWAAAFDAACREITE